MAGVSPLTLAMMGGFGSGGAMADPALLTMIPRMQLAQSMMAQGADTSPASPMQALARVVNSFIGSKMLDAASQGIGQVEGQAAQNAAATLPEGHPLRAALMSPDPMVRAQAMQAYKIALTQESEPYTQSAGQTRMIGSTPIATSSAPQSPQGKLAADAANATNPVAQSALTSALIKEGTDNGVMYGPNGAALVSGIVPARSALAGAIAGAEAGAKYPFENAIEQNKPIPLHPGDTVNVNPNRITPGQISSTLQPGGAPFLTGRPVDTAVTTREPTPAPSAAQPPTPAAVEKPKATPAGTTATSPAGVTLASGITPPEAVRPLIEADTKEVAQDRENALKGQTDQANIRMIQDFLPKVQTGWSTETKLEGARVLKAMGVPEQKIDDFLHTDVAAGQILQKKFVELSAAAARTMGAREPGSVIHMFAKAYPNLGTDPQAITLQTNALYMDRQRANDLANAKTNYLNESVNGYNASKGYRGLNGFNEQFNKTHPAEYYLHAAEAMSGVPQPWQRITDPAQQQAVIDLIPSGTRFLAPDGKMRIKP